jgi:hypothetical protein
MVGLIQKILFDMILDIGGEEKLAEIKKLAKLPPDRSFQINLVYSDEEWQRLLDATLQVLNVTQEQAEDVYSDYFFKDVIKRFPAWFNSCKNSYEFLLIQPTIHNCFATGVSDPKDREIINDKFKVEKFPNKITTHYKSHNKLCSLYRALARGVIHYYKDEAIIEEVQCMKSGAPECIMHIQWKNQVS